MGACIGSGVSRNTDIVVVGYNANYNTSSNSLLNLESSTRDKAGAKLEKAEEYGCQIWNEEKLMKILSGWDEKNSEDKSKKLTKGKEEESEEDEHEVKASTTKSGLGDQVTAAGKNSSGGSDDDGDEEKEDDNWNQEGYVLRYAFSSLIYLILII